jgi:hypothetical protein
VTSTPKMAQHPPPRTRRQRKALPLVEHARALGIDPADYPDEALLRQRVEQGERYRSTPRLGMIFIACLLAMGACAVGTLLALYLLDLI